MKYAVASSEDGGTVSVKARVKDDELQLEVLDTGPGMATADSVEERGVGLRNTVDRLRTLYEDRFVLETSNRDPDGLAVMIRFPFQMA